MGAAIMFEAGYEYTSQGSQPWLVELNLLLIFDKPE
jgi:hypothetical protein